MLPISLFASDYMVTFDVLGCWPSEGTAEAGSKIIASDFTHLSTDHDSTLYDDERRDCGTSLASIDEYSLVTGGKTNQGSTTADDKTAASMATAYLNKISIVAVSDASGDTRVYKWPCIDTNVSGLFHSMAVLLILGNV